MFQIAIRMPAGNAFRMGISTLSPPNAHSVTPADATAKRIPSTPEQRLDAALHSGDHAALRDVALEMCDDKGISRQDRQMYRDILAGLPATVKPTTSPNVEVRSASASRKAAVDDIPGLEAHFPAPPPAAVTSKDSTPSPAAAAVQGAGANPPPPGLEAFARLEAPIASVLTFQPHLAVFNGGLNEVIRGLECRAPNQAAMHAMHTLARLPKGMQPLFSSVVELMQLNGRHGGSGLFTEPSLCAFHTVLAAKALPAQWVTRLSMQVDALATHHGKVKQLGVWRDLSPQDAQKRQKALYGVASECTLKTKNSVQIDAALKALKERTESRSCKPAERAAAKEYIECLVRLRSAVQEPAGAFTATLALHEAAAADGAAHPAPAVAAQS